MEGNQGGTDAFQGAHYESTRQFALLHMGESPDSGPTAFIAITDHPHGDQHVPGFYGWGIHHFSMWVDDIDIIVARLMDGGVEIIAPPVEGDFWGWAMPTGRIIKTVLVKDPDGNAVQLDQFVS